MRQYSLREKPDAPCRSRQSLVNTKMNFSKHLLAFKRSKPALTAAL